jgi:hypothetical protein
MDGFPEDLMTATHCESQETGKEFIKRGQYVYFVHHLMTITDQWDSDAGQVAAAIDILTEDALIEIFDFLLFAANYDTWHTLVHVCRRWRNVVFGSSSYLDLVLLCQPRTPVRHSLDIWPPLPIIIIGGKDYPTSGLDNVVAALEHNDRVYEVTLQHLSISQLEEVVAAMEQPFPELTYLELRTDEKVVPALPDSFLGRSAPYLTVLKLFGIPFPALPFLLLSTPYLESLYLCYMPHSGYISPNSMLTCLSALTSLEELSFEFYSPHSFLRSQLAARRLRRRTRTFLPVLRRFSFTGSSKYVEDLMAWIDAPLLERLVINLFDELVFDTPQLVRLISRTPMFEQPIEAHVFFEGDGSGRVILPSSKRIIGTEAVTVDIRCRELDRALSCLAQICSSSLPSVSSVECFYISEDGEAPLHWQDNIENTRWWDLLRPFTAVKNLYLSKILAPRIAPALRELFRESTPDVLPKLQNIFLENFQPSEPAETAIWQFVSARHVGGHPIAVAHWDRELDTWKEDDFW